MTGREPAWRVIAREISTASEEERGSGDRVASYLITPLGARVNRAVLVGHLGVAEMVGRDESNPFYRARFTDPTGEISVTAGGFHPRALSAFRLVDSPRPALVIGKAHLYRGRDGVAYSSLRAEAVRFLAVEDRWPYFAETLDQVSTRFELCRRWRKDPGTDPAALTHEGFPADWVSAARLATERYPSIELDSFVPTLESLARSIRSRSDPDAPTERAPATAGVTITRAPPPTTRPAPSAGDRAQESAFLDLIDELGEKSLDGYADLRDVVEVARSRGLDERTTEELVGRLEEAGAVEEPIVGKLRRA